MSDLDKGGIHRGFKGSRIMGQPWNRADLINLLMPARQADATIGQANPVSAVLYNVLPTTANVRIHTLMASIDWATTQPAPLDIVVTIDGQSIVFSRGNPVSAAQYTGLQNSTASPAGQNMVPYNDTLCALEPQLQGKSVRVDVRITWAVTQPTLLQARVKYSVWT